MFMLFSGQVFAGNADECDYLKDKNNPDYDRGLYGLCIAWHNADDEAAAALAEKFFERAGFPVTGRVVDDGNDPFVCPCWDVDVLENIIACSGYTEILSSMDSSEDESGFDLVWFINSGTNVMAVAGYTDVFDDESTECFVTQTAGENKPQYSPTDEDLDAACRLDVLDLMASPPQAEDCIP
jgi:hypothetical protein